MKTMTNLTRHLAPRPIMKEDAAKQQTNFVTTILPSLVQDREGYY